MAKKQHSSPGLTRDKKRAGSPIPAHLRPRPALDYELDAKPDHRFRSALRTLTPGLNYLTRSYHRQRLRRDAVAGVAVAAYLVPQVMAYSALIGVPPVVSLWTALAAIVAYAVLGSSRILSSGPESTIALMTGVAIAPMAANNPDRAIALSATLALIVAGWCVLARLLRAGIIAELLSTPLLTGYLAGSAVLMVVSQLANVTGTSYDGGSIVEEVPGFLSVATDTNWLALTIAASTLATILLLAWLRASLPGPLIAVTVATVASAALNLESHGVAVVGPVPSGLPLPHLPAVTFDDVTMLLLAGLGITIVGYSDVMLIARGFPLTPTEGETAADLRPDPQAELVAMAGVHAMAGMFSGYPVSASGSRTALAIAGRAGSQVYSLVAALCIVAILFVAGPLMAPLPWAALGGVVVYAASKLVSIPEFRRLWSFRRREFVLAVITLVGTVVVGILQGVVLAIALSLLEMLFRLARPHEGVLGRVPGIAGMHDVDDYPDARTIPGCMFYRYDAPLFFANIGDLRERVHKLLALENQAYPNSPVRWFVLNVEANTEIDITAADGVRELARELAGSGVHLALARVKNDLYVPLERAGVIDAIGKDRLFATLPVAEESYLRWALAQEQAQPVETPAEVVDDEPVSSLLPWHRPPHDNRDTEPDEPVADSAADPSDEIPPDRRRPR